MMDDASLLELERLRKLKGNWYSVARLVSETLAANGWKPSQIAAKDWLTRASLATGLNVNTIGRMIAVREFIDQFGTMDSAGVIRNPDSLPFSTLEILKRIHGMDSSLTPTLLPLVIGGQISLRELRVRHESLLAQTPRAMTDSRSAAKRRGSDFERKARQALNQSLPEFGCSQHFKFVVRTAPSREEFVAYPDAMAISSEGRYRDRNLTAVGFDLVSQNSRSATWNVKSWQGILFRASYISSFFNRFYVIFPWEADLSSIQRLADGFSSARRFNIGVVLLKAEQEDGQNGTFEFLSRPAVDIDPEPDCRRLIDWSSGGWDRRYRQFIPNDS